MSQSVTVQRKIASPIEQLWFVLTNKECFAEWFGTEQAVIPLETLHFSGIPGESWKAVMMLPDGTSKDWSGEFLASKYCEFFSLSLTDDPDNPAAALPLNCEIVQDVDGLELRLTQQATGFTSEDIAALTQGYESFLDAIVRVLHRLSINTEETPNTVR